MAIDRSDFLILATTLAAGGAGGWFFRDQKHEVRPPPAPSAAPVVSAPPAPTGPVPVTIVDSKKAPACDDTQGTPEQCPSIGPADEGICANLIYKRCSEFKTAFKPRIAKEAVACLRALKGYERCDPIRINQCGHMSLMAACPEPLPAPKAELLASGSAGAGGGPTVTLSADPTAPAAPVATACEGILKACNKLPIDPTLADCRQTLAGFNDLGRANMVDCVGQHCTDRGLWACEAVPKLPVSP